MELRQRIRSPALDRLGGRRWDVDIRGTARNPCALRGAPIARRRARFALEQLAARSYGAAWHRARLDAAHRQHTRRADAGSGGCLSPASLAQPDQYQHSRARSGDHLRQYRAAHQSHWQCDQPHHQWNRQLHQAGGAITIENHGDILARATSLFFGRHMGSTPTPTARSASTTPAISLP